jgi:hypothetical protein
MWLRVNLAAGSSLMVVLANLSVAGWLAIDALPFILLVVAVIRTAADYAPLVAVLCRG